MIRLLLLAGVAFATPLLSPAAHAIGRLADISIVDRDSGRVLPLHAHGGEFWIEARPGARYAIRVRNTQELRMLAVTSVDGVNVVTGETAAPDQRGYVFEPWSSHDIAGWRKSDERIAAFEFTSVPRSYAAKTGRPDHVGAIGVALFREKAVPVAVPAPAPGLSREWQGAREQRADASEAARAERAPALGTGHGRSEHSVVSQVAFERAHAQPDEVIRLRYDSRANLVAMGIVRDSRRGRPEPFPVALPGYVPDP